MRELVGVFANEWMKLVRRRRFLVTAILSIFVVALFGVVANHQYHNERQNNPVTQTQSQITELKQQIASLEGQPESKDRDDSLNQAKQNLSSAEDSLRQMQQAQSGDWKAQVKHDITMNQGMVDKLKGSKYAQDVEQAQFAQAQVMQLQYNLDHDVKPLGWPNINAFQEVSGFMSVGARIFLPLLVVILVADMISGEATDGTIKLLLIRPVSRTKILLGKWLVSLVATCIWSFALCAVLLLTGFGIMGTRAGNQPVLTNVYYTVEKLTQSGPLGGQAMISVAHYDHATVMSQWHFVLTGFLYTALAMMVVATISLLCSTLFRSAMVSTAAAMGSIVVGFIVMQMARHEAWVNWLFPTHLNLIENWSGQLSDTLQQDVSLASGLTVLGVWGIVALIVSLVQFSKRDVLNA